MSRSRPPMGWNSFDSYTRYLDEGSAYKSVDIMADILKPFGYQYFVVDSGWYNEYRLREGSNLPLLEHPYDFHTDRHGRYLPSATYFPGGIAPLADYCHSLGLKFGLHIIRGVPRKAVDLDLPVLGTRRTAREIATRLDPPRGCWWNLAVDMAARGAQDYYDRWVELLVSWGVDLIKVDKVTASPQEMEAIANSVAKCGDSTVLSFSPGGYYDVRLIRTYDCADTVRVTRDAWDNREDLNHAFAACRAWPRGRGIEVLPDLDSLCLGRLRVRYPKECLPYDIPENPREGYERWCELSPAQQRTFVTIRSLAGSPLFMGGDLLSLDAETVNLVTNRELLACNQNGVMGELKWEMDDMELWLASLDGSPGSGWFGVFNRARYPQRMQLSLDCVGLDSKSSPRLVDVFGGATLQYDRAQFRLDKVIAGDDVLFVRFHPDPEIE